MPPPTDLQPDALEQELPLAGQPEWRPLRLFNVYRAILSGLFIVSYSSAFVSSLFPQYHARLFLGVAVAYFSFAVFSSVMIRQRWLPFPIQALFQGIGDVIAIVCLMHATGGISGGLGTLLVVAIAGNSILTEGRTAFFLAALASMGVLGETLFSDVYDTPSGYTQAGILGATLFATAFLAHVLAQRIRVNEALARERGLHLQYLAKLNEQIVQRIQSGIVVIDVLGRVRLMNQAALQLLGIPGELPEGAALKEAAPELAQQVLLWRRNQDAPPQVFRPSQNDCDLLPTFTRLSRAGAASVLILVEDATLTTRRAQEFKLAALGQLTASIAHEVRNPLGAISHAAQLLAESPALAAGDRRLSEIIINHSQRVSAIVNSILQLSRQHQPEQQEFLLLPWLERFVRELREAHGLAESDIVWQIPDGLRVYFDPGQWHQVLWNLCENALRYSRARPLLEFRGFWQEETRRGYLDVQDRGAGIPAPVAERIFDPFFTTDPQGTGLGLYIAREICICNQATLRLIGNTPAGCCFRIGFINQAEDIA
jgi:two-component system sensor histidine kinase PilS (NtrC family)